MSPRTVSSLVQTTLLPVTVVLLFLLLFSLVLALSPVHAQSAETTLSDCTESGLDSALDSTSGDTTILLDCTSGTTIALTSQKNINAAVTLRAIEPVTLTSNGRSRHFFVRSGGALTLENLTLSGGTADYGGAIYVDGSFVANHVTFAENRALDYGGGVYVHRGTAELFNTNFIDNSAQEGGALFVDFQSTATLQDAVVSRNSARYGGGIAVGYRGDLTIIDSLISDNQARLLGDGGGIYVDDRARLTVTGSTIRGNRATYGGGIEVERRAAVTLVASTLSGNSAREGGGAAVSLGVLSVENSTISGNSADLGGGGIYVEHGNIRLVHATLANNQASLSRQAGGIYAENRSTLEFYNSVFDNPGSPNCYYDRHSAPVVVVASLATDQTCGSSNMHVADSAQLGSLGDNGGLTETHLPAAESPVLDGGDLTQSLASDQRGMARPDGAAPDIGAVERQPSDR